VLAELPCTTHRWRAGDFSDAAYAGLYFLHWQLELHGGRCAARKSKNAPKPTPLRWLAQWTAAPGAEIGPSLLEWLGGYQFLGVSANVTAALCAWLRNEWPLRLYTRIPAPLEVLALQARGLRPVTVLADFPRLLRPVLSKTNGYTFMAHDLEHAWKFHHDPDLHRQQRALFSALHSAIARGLFASCLDDARFAEKFDYLISDMNSHPAHSRQYLRAILIERQLRAEDKDTSETLSPSGWQSIAYLLASAGLMDEQEIRRPACPT